VRRAAVCVRQKRNTGTGMLGCITSHAGRVTVSFA